MRAENSKAVLVAVDIGELLGMKFPLSVADKKRMLLASNARVEASQPVENSEKPDIPER